MEVPDDLKNFLKLDKAELHLDVTSVLVDPEKKGTVISVAALVEEELTRLLTAHAITKKMTFHEKIEAAKKLFPTLDTNATNYNPHLEFLRGLKVIRNEGAHSYGADMDLATRLAQDAEVAFLATDFPNNLWARVEVLRDYITTLIPEAK